jgi:hypothetical protein
MKIEIILTDVEVAALKHIMEDPKEWLENSIRERARLAYQEILESEMQRMLNDPSIETIPASSDQIVLNAQKVTLPENRA